MVNGPLLIALIISVMTSLALQTAQAFAPSGALAVAANLSQQNFQPRAGQQQMRVAVGIPSMGLHESPREPQPEGGRCGRASLRNR